MTESPLDNNGTVRHKNAVEKKQNTKKINDKIIIQYFCISLLFILIIYISKRTKKYILKIILPAVNESPPDDTRVGKETNIRKH